MQLKDCFGGLSDDMNMSGRMIIRIDHHPVAIESKNCRHGSLSQNPIDWVKTKWRRIGCKVMILKENFSRKNEIILDFPLGKAPE
jgi:hypothetical protein